MRFLVSSPYDSFSSNRHSHGVLPSKATGLCWVGREGGEVDLGGFSVCARTCVCGAATLSPLS
jgi:hypothetical protein